MTIMEMILGMMKEDGSSTLLIGVVGTTLSILVASAVWKQWQILQKREIYDKWITQARSERDAKVHKVLLETPASGSTSQGQRVAASNHDESSSCLSAVETNDLVRRGTLNARDNVLCVAHRIRMYGRKLNAVAEELYDQAAEATEKLGDAKNHKKNNSSTSPLYGVPLSIKECIGMKGTYSTGGLACRLKSRDVEDSVIVKVLRQQGALPICTANTIQMMMLTESVNRIWGRAQNPWNLERCTGGSSGGDAALVAMGCVPLALASDVAGSIRIPACFCGVTGFKPTKRRISSAGNMKPRVNDRSGTSELIPASVGPIAKTVDDCAAFLKTVLVPSMFQEDVNVAPMPFDDTLYKNNPKKLRIAYYISDGWFEPCRTSRRAVHETVEGLREQGHECVELELPVGGFESYCLLVALNAGDGSFKAFLDGLEGEQPIDEYKTIIMASKLPDAVRWILIRLLDKRRSTLLQQTRASGLSVREYWEKTADLTDFKAKWATVMKDFDAVVYPGMPVPALKHGTSGELTCIASYMFTASLLDWPCGAVPVATVRPEEACYPMDELPQIQQDHISKLVQQTMQGSAGLPVGVSVMTPAFQDEKCLQVMKEVERAVSFTAIPEAYKTGV